MKIIKKHADEITLVLCACGCGEMIRRFTWARERKWVLGHHKRLIFTSIGSAATRTIRAFSLTDKNCYINNEDCHGALQEHISIRTNSTFVILCRTHHNLMDRRRISLAELKNRFNYWIDGSGKRRYGYKVDRHYKKQNRDGRHFAENNYKNKGVMDQ